MPLPTLAPAPFDAPPEPANPPVDPARLQRTWLQAFEVAKRDCKDFVDDGKRIVERYRNESKVGGKARNRGMPILYANTEQLSSALYQKPAKPDVRRRFSDRDPVGQATADMVERALTYFDDDGNADEAIQAAIQDLLLPGRGIVRIEYEPIIGEQPATDPVTGQPLFEVDDDGEVTDQQATVQFIADQRVHHHYVFWQDVLISPARRWADVSWIAFRHVMDGDDIVREVYDNAPPTSAVFGSPSAVPLDWQPDMGERTRQMDDTVRRAEVWEVWDKPTASRLWIVRNAGYVLRIDQDPYELEGFFPLPEPLAGYRTNDSIVPIALYKSYQDQAEDLDEITRRISVLTKALKRRGIYDQSIPELKRLASANDNEFIPSPSYKNLVTNGGLAGAMQVEDITVVAGVILQLMKQRDAQVQSIYEITGISDIMRGSTDPDETLGAQQLKAQTGSMRLRKMQAAVQRFIRDLYRIKVDLLCRHFQPDVLQQITNMPVTPEIMATLQSDAMRSYRIDIETDSTIYADAAQMQQSRAQLVQGVTELWTGWAPIVQQRPQLAGLLFKLTEFAVAPAQDARMVQDAIDEAQQALAQAQAAPQQPPVDPAAAAKAQQAQAQAQAAQIKAQGEAQKAQTAVQVAQIQAQGVATKAQADVQSTALKIQSDRESHLQDLAHAQALHDQAIGQAAQAHEMDMQRQALAAQVPQVVRGRPM